MSPNFTQAKEVDLSTDDSHTDVTNLMEQDLRPWENSDPFISAHARSIIRTALDCYIQQFICVAGIPGNVICCAVFLKQGLSDRINLLLFWMAVADLINVVAIFISWFRCYIQTWDKVQALNWAIVMDTTVVNIGLWASFVSGGLIMIMSVDRCLSVVMPLKAGRLLSYRPMLVAIAVTFWTLLILQIPLLLGYSIKWRVHPFTNRSMAYRVLTDWFPFHNTIQAEIRLVIVTVLKSMFIIVVTVCSIITTVTLRQATRKRLQMQETGNPESDGIDNRITKVLLFLCVVYVVLFLPEMLIQIAVYLFPEFYVYRTYHNTFIVIYGVIFTASSLNSTANFFAYLALSSKFRTTLRELCQRCGVNLSSRITRNKPHRTL